ncbi:GntR family transcriptional regulator [Williamsia sp.]|uniref:GntR family transcriptional regulator n=1 Tax=Williamsia sp. TaxID=1872085 RepID=UPI0039C96C1D
MSAHQPHRPLISYLSGELSGSAQAGIFDELRRVILDGSAPPGSAIPVGSVAELFGVSAIPVREALKTLVGEGLVDHRTGGGYYVAQLTLTELREIYIVRGVLEEAALTRACALATGADLDLARVQHRALQEATIAGDRRAYHVHSRRFHQALVNPCGMHRLLNMFDSTWDITEPFQVMQRATGPTQLQLHADHEKMINAMARRDAAELVAVAQEHHRRLESVIIDTAADLNVAREDSPPAG